MVKRNGPRRMVLAEAVLLTAIGLLAGVYLSYVMVMAMQAAGYPFLSYPSPCTAFSPPLPSA